MRAAQKPWGLQGKPDVLMKKKISSQSAAHCVSPQLHYIFKTRGPPSHEGCTNLDKMPCREADFLMKKPKTQSSAHCALGFPAIYTGFTLTFFFLRSSTCKQMTILNWIDLICQRFFFKAAAALRPYFARGSWNRMFQSMYVPETFFFLFFPFY